MSSNMTLLPTLITSTLPNPIPQTPVNDQSNTAEIGYTEDECMYHVNSLPAQKAMYGFLGASLIINFSIFLWWFRMYHHRRKHRKREEQKAYEEACEAWEADESRNLEEAARAEKEKSDSQESDATSKEKPPQKGTALRRPLRARGRQATVSDESDEETVVELDRPKTRAAMRRQLRQEKAEQRMVTADDEKTEIKAYQKAVYKPASKAGDTV